MKEESPMPLRGHPEIKVNFDCHREEPSDVTIPNGIASISTFGIIEAMPLWIATHSFGMLAMTDQAFIYKGATGVPPVAKPRIIKILFA